MADTHPKVFISYSWSSQEHENWVIRLATSLREDGVDVIFDKWDLEKGNDAYQFMETMVTEPNVKKVIMVCDKKYVDKANNRKDGVGTEAQIISPLIYKSADQNKFVAALSEKDEYGKPYLPAFYSSRIYIDLSNEDIYQTNYDNELLRWIYDKPLYKKPPLGTTPSFITEDDHIILGTSTLQRRLVEAIRNQKENRQGLLAEYFEQFTVGLEQFRMKKDGREVDVLLLENIENFLPYRNEVVQVFLALARFEQTDSIDAHLHRFFESLLPYYDAPQEARQYSSWDFDNFKFIIHELYLYLITVLIKSERFSTITKLLNEAYFLPRFGRGTDRLVDYIEFRPFVESLENRNNRLKLNRISIHADLLKERSTLSQIPFDKLMQSDYVLWFRTAIKLMHSWWPITLVYAAHYHPTFEIFIKAQSRNYFDKMKCMLDINSKEDVMPLIEAIRDRKYETPKFDIFSKSLVDLAEHDKWASLP